MVVTRFAPSPTGYLHVGGARTALFNWLLAKKTGGKFILRIEDTDTKRNTPTAAQQVMDDLKWLGLNWDEGPGIGGENGPYLQSERRDIYNKYIQQLLDEGKAYYCFETQEELAAIRDVAAKAKKALVYSRPEKYPTLEDVEKAKSEGRPVVVRFAMPDCDTVITDVIRGEVNVAAGEIGDFIIKKSDGFPTYHMAVVIDDELMGVTHIIRGQEHLMNTPGHQALQDALGFRRPTYVHMSVTVSEGGGKLSKRERPKALKNFIKSRSEINVDELVGIGGITAEELESFVKGKTIPDMPIIDAIAKHIGLKLPEINVVDFFKSGYLPETMINFLGMLGWSTSDDREVMQLAEQIECFDLKRMAKSNSLFDRKKLLSFNTEHMKLVGKEELLANFKNYLKEISSPLTAADDELLKRFLAINEGARTLAEIEVKCKFVFVENDAIEYDKKAVKKVLKKGNALEMLAEVRRRFVAMEEITAEGIEKLLRDLAEEKEVGLGKVAQPLRVAICGNTISPPIFESVDIIGMQSTLERIDKTLEKFSE